MCFSKNMHQQTSVDINKIKILTWNVEGYMTKNNDEGCKNKLNVSYVNRILQKHDIICMNETWTNVNTEKDIHLSDFTPFCSSRGQRNKKAYRDSGGVAILVRDNMLRFVSRQPNVYEDAIWLKLDKTLFGTTKDIYLGNIYLPPERSSSNITSDQDKYDLIEREIQLFLNKGSVLICGDLNSRTGTKLDHIPFDSRDTFINLPPSYLPDSDTIKKRCNLDSTVNNYGKKLLDICIGNALQIINGRTCGDFFGNFTCLKYNGNSVVDYNIISKDAGDIVSSFEVLPLFDLSDHKPLSLELYVKDRPQPTIQPDIPLSEAPGKFIFDIESKRKFIDTLLLPTTQQRFQLFKDKRYVTNVEDVENATKDFTCIILDVARTSARFIKPKIRKKISKPWFDSNCFNARKNFLFYKDLYSKYPHKRSIRETFYSYARFYRKLKRKSENAFTEDILRSLKDQQDSHSGNFWNSFYDLLYIVLG